jgi:hypothetical protein
MFAVERLGVSAADSEFSRWGWAFREQPVADFGIDAHVEPFHDSTPSGRLIALQIKAGPSYFSEDVPGGWVYRGNDTHLLYWLRHCLPVVLLLHDPEARITYWAHVRPDKVEYTKAGWKMLVPSAQVLTSESRDDFKEIAETAPGASDDPVEKSCILLPPSTAEVLRSAAQIEPGGTLHLAAMLAEGRGAARLAVESVLSAAPSWLPKGQGIFEVALATYAGEHGHPDLAAQAFTQAAGYEQQSAERLFAFAALSAAEAGDVGQARALVAQAQNGRGSALLFATVEAVVEHIGQPGPVPIPDILATAGPSERAAEPTCLSFLGVQALRRQEVTAAVRYFEEGCSAQPDSTSMMLQLVQALQMRVVSGQSAVEAEDMRRIEEAGRGALEQRRRWSGPSSPALGVLIRRQMLVGAFEAAVRLATPAPDGEAFDHEAAADEVVILGVQAALTLGDQQRAAEFAARVGSAHAAAVVAALQADPLDAGEQVVLWRAVGTEAAPIESRLMALHRLACLGVWPLPGLDELRDAGSIDGVHYDILAARAMAGRGELTVALSTLRSHAATSPIAAEMLVDVLQGASRFDEALDEAARGFEQFGEAILAHKRLNLLVLADHPDEAAAEAVRLLARADTAPELRLRTRRRLIGHYAHNGDWPAVEEQSRAALVEFPGLADLEWGLIAATCNRGRLDRGQELFEQFDPEISATQHAGLWMSLHMHNGFSCEDVNTALELMDRWRDDASFVGQVLTAFLAAAGRRGPSGALILPDLDPQTSQRFQAALLTYTAQHPDGPLQPTSSDPHDLAEMLRAHLAPQAERIEAIERQVRAGRMSVGVLAALLDRSYARALIQRACGIILAVSPDPGPFVIELDAAQAALDGPVIIQSSAIAVATTLLPDRWPQLRGSFTEVRLPRDAWMDFRAAREELLRDPDSTFSISYDPRNQVLVRHQFTEEEHGYLTQRFIAIDTAMRDLSLAAVSELGALADYTPGDTDVALSPLALAAETGTTLWCDDIVLRGIAREHGIPAFGTLALLHALIDADRTPDTLREDVIRLARGYVTDIMLAPDELLSLAAENQYKPGPATAALSRPVFWAAPETATDIFLELVDAVNTHAPDTLSAWLHAASAGLAARRPEGALAEHAESLAEATAARIHADSDTRERLIRTAKAAAEAHQAAQPEVAQPALPGDMPEDAA